MTLKQVFKMPKPVKITGRTSSITNSFVNGIIPVIEPTEEEIREALTILGMDENTICCAYCGDKCTEWDHLRPLVVNKTATGYVSEIHNLVPACGKCNQSKGNQNWHEWMFSTAALSPATRNITDIELRSKRLTQYENWGTPLKIDFEAIIGRDKWQQHWENCEKIKNLMHDSQALSDEIRITLQNTLNSSNGEVEKCLNNPKSTESCIISDNIDKRNAIGKIVQTEFISLLTGNCIDKNVIEFLQKSDYSKQIFDVNFPILLHIDSPADSKKGIDHTGVNRYYAKPIQIRGELYLVTSQWYERSREKLIRWMSKYL